MWYLACLIQPIILPVCWGSMRHTQRGVPGRHPYLTMSGYPLNVPVLKYWYLVPLTKVLLAAGLYYIMNGLELIIYFLVFLVEWMRL